MRIYKQRGFTVLELMITVSVAAVLATVAVPSFSSFMSNNRITAQANSFHSSILYARSEAVKRNVQVAMCGSSNSAAVNPCGTASSGWTDGWLMFVDDNENGQRDGTEAIIKTNTGVTGGSTFSGNSNVISYTNDGRVTTSSLTFKLCDADNDDKYTRELTISPLGNPKVSKSGTCP